MPIYVYGCACGLRFEKLSGFDDAPPGCPSCGGETRKVPTAVGLSGRADPGLAKDFMPQTWRGVHEGDREYVTGMQRRWEQRQKLGRVEQMAAPQVPERRFADQIDRGLPFPERAFVGLQSGNCFT